MSAKPRELRIALVGAGHMGRLHAEKVKALAGEGLWLQGVADPVESRARSLAEEFGVRAEDDYERLIGDCDVAIVAVPTVAHAEIVETCLQAGLAAVTVEAARLTQVVEQVPRVPVRRGLARRSAEAARREERHHGQERAHV